MRFRSFAIMLVLSLVATPVLGVVCEIDCDQLTAVPACHASMASSNGPTVGGAPHACGHEHTAGSPALVGSSARDSVTTFPAAPVPTVAGVSIPNPPVAIAPMHGPPGLSGRSASPGITILRI